MFRLLEKCTEEGCDLKTWKMFIVLDGVQDTSARESQPNVIDKLMEEDHARYHQE